jgi:GAF domain-containing protein
LVDLFDDGQRVSMHAIFLHQDYPKYFAAIDNSRVLSVDDVSTHSATQELLASYLNPLGITSMLDVPIIIEGRMRGGHGFSPAQQSSIGADVC